MSKGRALALSAVIVTVATLLGRIFGFAREVVIANKFGASIETDTFLVAFTIPNVLYSLIVMGALSASFIPIFSGLLANDKEKEAWRLAYAVLNLLLIAFGLVTTILVIFAPQVILLAAPGFAESSHQLELGTNLLRLMAPALIFLGISGLLAGVLNSYNHFAMPSMVALVQNIIVVVTTIVLAGKMGIYGVGIGLLLGSIGQVLIQLPVLIKRGIPHRPSLSFRHDELVNMGKLFVPVLISLGASQSNTIIDKWMASFLADGSISFLNFAYKVGSLPLNTFIAAIAIVLFPTLSQQVAKGDLDTLRNTISTGVRVIALVTIPASVGLFVLSVPITGLLFEHGAFDHDSTLATAPALAVYSFGLLAAGLNMLIVRTFYALKDGVTLLKVSVAFVVALVVLDLIFIRFLSHVGLALGYTIAMSLMALTLLLILRKRLRGLDGDQIIRALLKTIVAAIAMGVTLWYATGILSGVFSSGSKLSELAIVSLSGFMGIVVYVLSLTIMRTSEILLVWRMAKSKFSHA